MAPIYNNMAQVGTPQASVLVKGLRHIIIIIIKYIRIFFQGSVLVKGLEVQYNNNNKK